MFMWNLIVKIFYYFIALCIAVFMLECVPDICTRIKHFPLFLHLQWINDTRNKHRYDPLYWYIAERSKNIDPIYALPVKDCEKYISEILDYFVKDINELYFQDNLPLNRRVLRLENEDYFLYRLFIFLDCHFEEPSFNGCRLYYIAEHIHYDDLGYELCDYTRSLTDFGIIYAKLLYAAYTACLSNKKLASMVQDNGWCEYLEKTIKNKE